MPALDTFDYVVVGGGTAGLVVATRLSEDADASVLVLEAGQDRLSDPRVSIPGMAGVAQRDSELAYRFQTMPQRHLNDRVITEPQGKMLGGSSGINNQAFIAPDALGIDAWEDLGNEGWNWKMLAPYFRKVFTRAVPDKEVRDGLGIGYLNGSEKKACSDTGLLQVSYTGTPQNPLSKAWVDTFKRLGFADAHADPFDGNRIGGYANPSSVEFTTKTRSYSRSAYLQHADRRTNLKVQTGATVEKIVFANEGSEDVVAKQINYIVGGDRRSVEIGKEVVLAAGALQSPKVLELSGIGDPGVLNKYGVEVVVPNKNVGARLQSRLMTGISFEVRDGIETLDDLVRKKPEVVKRATEQYQQGKGLLTVGGLASYSSMPYTATEVVGQPPLEPLLAKTSFSPDDRRIFEVVNKLIRTPQLGTGAFWISPIQWPIRGQIQPGSYVTLGTNQCYAFSRGSVHISSADSSVHPVIDPNYLAHELDIEVLARQVFWLQTLSKCSPLKECFRPNGRRNHETAYFRNLDDAKDYVRESATTEYHPCGTCAMLPKEIGGVVSSSLTVYGTQNVRVVDSSMMPLITSSNLQPTVYAVAERAADLIRGRA
ncbi:hypothetical protein PMZ80_004900 [Knufia obscura]|uniref:Glucose-methanol-choline oxidoreductase N-terminal domain-containing protein n=2 Tax=Knufia TaxID=430999 RepID=A0AAN8IIC7_9EURO|nr:hypothetical protein PMZ80_004900 [Knufia obscura]KAK5948982.1 hypothetical protein OHC33_010068 [Knufia fluminis]